MKTKFAIKTLMTLCIGTAFLVSPCVHQSKAQKFVGGGQIVSQGIINKGVMLTIKRLQFPEKVSQGGKEPAKASFGKVFVVVPFDLDGKTKLTEVFLEDSTKRKLQPLEINNRGEMIFEVPRGFIASKLTAKSDGASEWQFVEIKKLTPQ